MDDDRIVGALRQAPRDEPVYRARGLPSRPAPRARPMRRGIVAGVAGVAVISLLAGVLVVAPILQRSPSPDAATYPLYKGGPGRTGEAIGGGPNGPDILWAVESESGLDSSPVVAAGTVVIVDGRDDLAALDIRTGAARWTVGSDTFVGSPAIADSTVVTQTDAGVLGAFDLADGEPVWRADLGIRANSSPLVASGLVVVATDDGRLVGVDAARGTLEWSATLGAGVDRSAAAADGLVFTGSRGAFVALEAGTGDRSWAHESEVMAFATPAVRDGVVYASGGVGASSILLAMDAVTGAELWRFAPPDDVELRSPSVDDETVFVASTERIYALDRTTGIQRWTRDLPRLTRAAIAIDGDTLFVFTESGLYALDALTGGDRWELVVGGVVDSGTTVVDGLLIAGVRTGRIMAIGSLPD